MRECFQARLPASPCRVRCWGGIRSRATLVEVRAAAPPVKTDETSSPFSNYKSP
jgi:hypothetical protein